jgi:hypothetical protein
MGSPGVAVTIPDVDFPGEMFGDRRSVRPATVKYAVAVHRTALLLTQEAHLVMAACDHLSVVRLQLSAPSQAHRFPGQVQAQVGAR